MKKLDQAIKNLSKPKNVEVETRQQMTEQKNSELALTLSKENRLAIERLSKQIQDKIFNESLNNRQGVEDNSFFYREMQETKEQEQQSKQTVDQIITPDRTQRISRRMARSIKNSGGPIAVMELNGSTTKSLKRTDYTESINPVGVPNNINHFNNRLKSIYSGKQQKEQSSTKIKIAPLNQPEEVRDTKQHSSRLLPNVFAQRTQSLDSNMQRTARITNSIDGLSKGI